MSRLLDLPNETLCEIARFVYVNECYERTKYLKALCHVCKRLRDIAQPVLFSEVSIYWNYSELEIRRFIKLSTSIVRREDMRTSVRVVEVYLGSEPPMSIPQDMDLTSLQQPLFCLYGEKSHWNSGVSTSLFPHLTSFFCLLKNIEILQIKMDDNQSEWPQIAELTPTFQRLREFSLCFPYTNEEDEMADETCLAAVFQLPQLRTFKLEHAQLWYGGTTEEYNEDKDHKIASEGEKFRNNNHKVNDRYDVSESRFHENKGESARHAPSQLEQNSLSVEHLHLVDCLADNETLSQGILACGRLVSFIYRVSDHRNHDYDADYDDGVEVEDHVDVGSLHHALSQHTNTLECLSLKFIPDFSERMNYGVIKPLKWPSFGSFTKLKILALEHRRMTVQGLPSSLEELSIYDFRDIISYDKMSDWIGIKDGCPKIKTVDVIVTDHCKSVQRVCKYYGPPGFRWAYGDHSAKIYDRAGFDLVIWFNEYLLEYRSVSHSEVTTELNSNGEKIPKEEYSDVHANEADYGDDKSKSYTPIIERALEEGLPDDDIDYQGVISQIDVGQGKTKKKKNSAIIHDYTQEIKRN